MAYGILQGITNPGTNLGPTYGPAYSDPKQYMPSNLWSDQQRTQVNRFINANAGSPQGLSRIYEEARVRGFSPDEVASIYNQARGTNINAQDVTNFGNQYFGNEPAGTHDLTYNPLSRAYGLTSQGAGGLLDPSLAANAARASWNAAAPGVTPSATRSFVDPNSGVTYRMGPSPGQWIGEDGSSYNTNMFGGQTYGQTRFISAEQAAANRAAQMERRQANIGNPAWQADRMMKDFSKQMRRNPGVLGSFGQQPQYSMAQAPSMYTPGNLQQLGGLLSRLAFGG